MGIWGYGMYSRCQFEIWVESQVFRYSGMQVCRYAGMQVSVAEYGVWSVGYGVWSMEYRVWSMEYGV
jgi:hypothetical protein